MGRHRWEDIGEKVADRKGRSPYLKRAIRSTLQYMLGDQAVHTLTPHPLFMQLCNSDKRDV